MNRLFTKHLLAWKDRASRMPLLIRGARQTGKTFVIQDFGQRYFANHVTINFELNPEFKEDY